MLKWNKLDRYPMTTEEYAHFSIFINHSQLLIYMRYIRIAIPCFVSFALLFTPATGEQEDSFPLTKLTN